MYKKLNYLASGLAPDYSAGGFMKGNLARLTVGGYLYNQLGIIKSITYTIPQESPWEIGVNIAADGQFDSQVKELPHMIKVTGFEFVPIQYDVARKGATKFIQLLAKSGTNWGSGMQMPDEQAAAIAKQKQIREAEAEQEKKDIKAVKDKLNQINGGPSQLDLMLGNKGSGAGTGPSSTVKASETIQNAQNQRHFSPLNKL
jgi:hypothetical protein